MVADIDSGKRRNCSERSNAGSALWSRRRGERRLAGVDTKRASTRRGKNDTKL